MEHVHVDVLALNQYVVCTGMEPGVVVITRLMTIRAWWDLVVKLWGRRAKLGRR